MKTPRYYIGGTFDLFHSGHLNLLKQVKQLGTVIVSLNTDKFAARYKRKPVMPLHERIAVLEACKYVDEVIINYGDEDSKPAIVNSKANFVVHADDWEKESLFKQMGLSDEWMTKHNVKFLSLPYTANISTTWLIQNSQLSVSPTEKAQQPSSSSN